MKKRLTGCQTALPVVGSVVPHFGAKPPQAGDGPLHPVVPGPGTQTQVMAVTVTIYVEVFRNEMAEMAGLA